MQGARVLLVEGRVMYMVDRVVVGSMLSVEEIFLFVDWRIVLVEGKVLLVERRVMLVECINVSVEGRVMVAVGWIFLLRVSLC